MIRATGFERFGASLALVGLTLASAPAIVAANDATPTPGTPLYCSLKIDTIVPLEAAADGGSTYAVFFTAWRSDGHRSAASGSVAIYAGDDRYDVSFEDAIAAASHEGVGDGTPAVMRFPSGVKPTAGYVASLSGPVTAPCVIANPWIATGNAEQSSPETAKLAARATGMKAVVASAPVREAPPACAKPFEDATVVKAVEPQLPAELQWESGTTQVRVGIRADSQIFDIQIYRKSGSPAWDRSVLSAASRSTYRAATFRCIPVSGEYFFRADFVHGG